MIGKSNCDGSTDEREDWGRWETVEESELILAMDVHFANCTRKYSKYLDCLCVPRSDHSRWSWSVLLLHSWVCLYAIDHSTSVMGVVRDVGFG